MALGRRERPPPPPEAVVALGRLSVADDSSSGEEAPAAMIRLRPMITKRWIRTGAPEARARKSRLSKLRNLVSHSQGDALDLGRGRLRNGLSKRFEPGIHVPRRPS